MDDETQNNDGMTRKRWNEQSGKIKYDLYKGAINKANKAIKNKFYIEAISIYESLISDRLESRLQFKNINQPQNIKTVGRAAAALRNNESKTEQPILYALYNEISTWAKDRNSAIHHLVKLSEEHELEKFNKRYKKYEKIALQGKDLFKKLKNEMDKQIRLNH